MGKMPYVKLYTPLTAAEAEAALRGEFPDGTYFFVDAPQPEEAAGDAVWVVTEIPEEQALPFEDA
jgi:hypothetical protein